MIWVRVWGSVFWVRYFAVAVAAGVHWRGVWSNDWGNECLWDALWLGRWVLGDVWLCSFVSRYLWWRWVSDSRIWGVDWYRLGWWRRAWVCGSRWWDCVWDLGRVGHRVWFWFNLISICGVVWQGACIRCRVVFGHGGRCSWVFGLFGVGYLFHRCGRFGGWVWCGGRSRGLWIVGSRVVDSRRRAVWSVCRWPSASTCGCKGTWGRLWCNDTGTTIWICISSNSCPISGRTLSLVLELLALIV